MIKKSLKDISWQVSEDTYRKDEAFSYSMLSRFDREGHRCIPHLFDKQDSTALRFGGLVDCLLTAPEEFEDRFLIFDFKVPTDTIVRIVKDIHSKSDIVDLKLVDRNIIFTSIEKENYSSSWKEDTRIDKIIDEGSEYYKMLKLSENKAIISQDEYKQAVNCEQALKISPYTENYFSLDPFSNVEKLFQLKFKSDSLYEHPVRCMLDEVIILHDAKIIVPVDLKTTGKDEHEFKKSFIDWRYYLQSSLYTKILKDIISRDEYFKDFTILPYEFLVVNKNNLTPLVYKYNFNHYDGDLIDNYGNKLKGVKTLITELNYHIKNKEYSYSYVAKTHSGLLEIDNIKPYKKE